MSNNITKGIQFLFLMSIASIYLFYSQEKYGTFLCFLASFIGTLGFSWSIYKSSNTKTTGAKLGLLILSQILVAILLSPYYAEPVDKPFAFRVLAGLLPFGITLVLWTNCTK